MTPPTLVTPIRHFGHHSRSSSARVRVDSGALESVVGTYATFPDGRRKAGVSPKPDIAGLLSMLVYEFTPQLHAGSTAHRLAVLRRERRPSRLGACGVPIAQGAMGCPGASHPGSGPGQALRMTALASKDALRRVRGTQSPPRRPPRERRPSPKRGGISP